MDSERWKQVDSLLQAVLERPPSDRAAFLREAAAGDEALEREVRSLLASHEQAGTFLDRPAMALAALLPQETGNTTETIAGRFAKLGPYRIDRPIGAGGMGEVFLATDTRLHRTVAIKILPRDKVADPERKRRFIQEARAASALNHPNIITLHDIANDGGVDYLVMEYAPGQPLSERIAAQDLPLGEAIEYAIQIANALSAAHQAGIVHRDIKPGNVVVTPQGQVKILDFGLAKLSERPSSSQNETRTDELPLTETGVVMGTIAYMSPEQARGDAVDARSDLFSFGAMLYEMATGRRAFLKRLDWTTPPAGSVPSGLRPIILKLIEVDRDLRYQTAADAVQDLKRLQGSQKAPFWRRWTISASVMLLAVTMLAAAFFYLRPSGPVGRDQWLRLTNFPDSVSQPALSPDGRMITFIRGAETFEGPGQIYVKLLPDGEPVQLTRDDVHKMSPVFSPDGSRIAYTVRRGLKWDTWVVPVVSGQPRLWLTNASGLAWIDKKRLLFSEVKNEDIHMGIVTAMEDRSEARDVYVPARLRGMGHRSYSSPDGKSALVVEMLGPWLPCRLVPMDGTSAGRPVGPSDAPCTNAGWSPDGKWMYFSSGAGGGLHTWRQRFPDGDPEQITSGLTEEEGIAVAPDGQSFVTSVAMRQSTVWVRDANGERQISLEGYCFDPKFTPDGKRLLYRILKGAAVRYPSTELRVVELATGDSEPLFPGIAITGQIKTAYDISRDGKFVIAGVFDQNGKRRIWLAALDRQSPPLQIPNVEGDTPVFGKDSEVYFRGKEGGSDYVYQVHRDGTGLKKISDQVITLQSASPDGRWFIGRAVVASGPATIAIPSDGGPPLPIVSGNAMPYVYLNWSADGKVVFIAIGVGQASSETGLTYVVPLQKGQTFPPIPPGGFQSAEQIRKLPGVTMEAFDAAPGPTTGVLAFSRRAVQRNLYRIPLR